MSHSQEPAGGNSIPVSENFQPLTDAEKLSTYVPEDSGPIPNEGEPDGGIPMAAFCVDQTTSASVELRAFIEETIKQPDRHKQMLRYTILTAMDEIREAVVRGEIRLEDIPEGAVTMHIIRTIVLEVPHVEGMAVDGEPIKLGERHERYTDLGNIKSNE